MINLSCELVRLTPEESAMSDWIRASRKWPELPFLMDFGSELERELYTAAFCRWAEKEKQ